MNHADPWDEIARLNKQMDAEFMRQLRSKQKEGTKKVEKNERAAKERSER